VDCFRLRKGAERSKKNQWYADQENLKPDSMSLYMYMDRGGEEADVTVHRIFKDGSTITRDTRFVYENGWWRHHLTEEEKRIFMPDASYEEFVKARLDLGVRYPKTRLLPS
jgi:hypothetical protein